MSENCGGCKFYRSFECRKSPPVRLPRQFSDKANAGNRVREETLIWGWPVVQPDDWCGEFTAKLQPRKIR